MLIDLLLLELRDDPSILTPWGFDGWSQNVCQRRCPVVGSYELELESVYTSDPDSASNALLAATCGSVNTICPSGAM